jgi:uncharacterized protein YqiB (DUF1249 family)
VAFAAPQFRGADVALREQLPAPGALAGDLRRLPDTRVSRVANDCDLRLSVTERSPYTTSFDLTYLFPAKRARSSTYPDMRVRIYHDARLVEAQEWASQHDHEASGAARAAERELDQRWARIRC